MTLRPRHLTASENAAFAACRLRAFELAPYFTHALLAVTPLAAPGLDTFAVDRSWRLYLDPDALTRWGPEASAGVLVHEVSHLVREHAARAEAIGPDVDRTVWNFATDAAINDDLLTAGITLPEGVVTPANLHLPANGTEEDYYDQLVQTMPPSNDPEGGCGSGAGDLPAPWEAESGQGGGLSPADQRITRRMVANAVAQSKARGTVPAGLARWADDALSTPPLPWQTILSATVRRAAALTTGAITYTYTRPSRRRVPGVVLPALRAPRVTVAVVIDTSGSMSPSDLAAALHETTAVVKALGGRVAVITCDAEAHTEWVTDPSRITLTGGGGTDMRVGITAATHTRPAPDAVVVLTDGYTPWPEEPTTATLIAALIGTNPPMSTVPSWATTVTITPSA